MFAVGEAQRRFGTRGRNHPDRSLIAGVLLVGYDARKSRARAVGRNTRITDPHKVEQIFFGDRALRTARLRARILSSQRSSNRENNDERRNEWPNGNSETV